MIHTTSPNLTTLLMAAEPPGGRHGIRRQAHRGPAGRTRPPSHEGYVGRRFPQWSHHSALGLARYNRLDRQASGVWNGHRQPGAAPVPPGRHSGPVSDQTAGPSTPSHSCVLARDEAGRPNQSPDTGLRVLEWVGGPPGRALGQGHRHSLQRRSASASAAPGRLFRSSSQAHHEGQTRRGRLRESQEKAGPSKKNAMKDDAPEALVFQDEVEIHRHPALARMWAPVGTQPEIPAPGKNEKEVVYGGVDYADGRITYTIAETKSGTNFLAFLVALGAVYVGRKIRLVCDNGRFHHTQAVQEWLQAHRNQITIFWLPPYCPSLNLIERLWGPLKRTVLANVLFKTLDDLVAAFRCGVARINGRRDKMSFIFSHDDVQRKAA